MKSLTRLILPLALGMGLLWLTPPEASADPRAQEIEMVQSVLDAYRIRPDQMQKIMMVGLRYSPAFLDETIPAGVLARRVEPDLRAVLDPEQYELLRLLQQEADRADDLGLMTAQDRRRWFQEAMQRMNHRDSKAWLQFLDADGR